jgi:transposase
MAAPVGPKKVHRYSLEFKIQAVRLANHPEIETQDVAHALDIHPFMLSKWKKDFREGKLKPAAEAAGLSLPKALRVSFADPEKRALKKQVKKLEAKVEARREVRALERKLAALEVEHDLLKKAIRFNIERRRRSSSS